MTPSAAWRWCAAAGIATTAASFAFNAIPNLIACTDTGGLGPIIAAELARTPADFSFLFGQDACPLLGDALIHSLVLDALAFIPAYAAFLMLALVALRPVNRRIALVGIGVTLAAALLDQIEGGLLWRIVGHGAGQGTIDALAVVVRIKFALLGASGVIIGALLIGRRGIGLIAGPIIAIGGAACLYGLIGDPRALIEGNRYAWMALLIAAIILSFGRKSTAIRK